MTDEKQPEKVDRSRLRLLAALSAGAAGGGCTQTQSGPTGVPRSKIPVSQELDAWKNKPTVPQNFGGGGGGGSGGGGGGGGGH